MVSVVIPVYNGAPYIADAIDSVLGQTYRPLECLVVDDGSTDRTAEIVERFGPPVRCLRKGNGGVASARNFGAAEAHGRYVAFLDAADVWRPDKLRKQMELLDATGAALVYSGADVVDRHLRPIATVAPVPPDVALRNTLLMEQPIMMLTSSTALMPLEVFRAVGGFDERLTTSADSDLACRIAARYPVAPVAESLAQYRQHDAQMHRNPRALEHDRLIVFGKFFGTGMLPVSVERLRRRAYANCYVTLAAAYLNIGQRRDGVRCALTALRHHPPRLMVGVWTIGASSLTRRVRRMLGLRPTA
jgi:glycosyltransferase involved in cell wall biosynthesis